MEIILWANWTNHNGNYGIRKVAETVMEITLQCNANGNGNHYIM